MKKLIFLTLTFLLLGFIFPSRINAQVSLSNFKDRVKNRLQLRQEHLEDKQEAIEERQEKRQEHRTQLCQRVQEKIQTRREHFAQLRDRHGNVHQGVISRLRHLIAKLKDKGCDTSQVEQDLNTFEDLIAELVAAFNLFLDKIHDIGIPVCQEKPGDWRTALAAAKDQLQLVRQKRRQIRSFYKNNLKPDLKALKQTCRQQLTASPEPEVTQ